MTTQYVRYCTDQNILCSDVKDAPVFISVTEIELLAPGTLCPVISGSIAVFNGNNNSCCNPQWCYLLAYDDAQLADPEVPLIPSNINGLWCSDTFTAWINCLITNAIAITTCVEDSDTIDFQVTDEHCVTGDVKISADEGNEIEAHADGIYAPSTSDSFITSISDTESIDLTVTAGDLTADAKVSADGGNTISVHADGLYAAGGGGGGVVIGDPVTGGNPGDILYVGDTGNTSQTSLFSNPSGLIYNPLNFFPAGTSQQFWAKLWDPNYVLDASDNPATNGVNIKTLLDSDGVTQIFQNTTVGTQPNYATGLIGGYGGLSFSASDILPAVIGSFLQNKTSGTLVAVFSLGSTASTTIYSETGNGNLRNRLSLLFSYYNPNLAALFASAVDSGPLDTIVQPFPITPITTYHLVIVEVNVTRGYVTIYLDGIPATEGYQLQLNGSGSYPNTTSGAVSIGGGAAFNLIDISLFTNGFLTEWGRMQLSAAVKNKFSLTTY